MRFIVSRDICQNSFYSMQAFRNVKPKLKSHLNFRLEDLTECYNNIDEAINLICLHRCDEISLVSLAKSFYTIVSSDNIIEYMVSINKKVQNAVLNIIHETLSSKKSDLTNLEEYLDAMSTIYENYIYLIKNITAIFLPFEYQLLQYKCNIHFEQEYIDLLIKTLDEEKIFHNFAEIYLDYLFKIVDSTDLDSASSDPRLKKIDQFKELLQKILPKQISIIDEMIDSKLNQFLLKWIENQGLPTNIDENPFSIKEEIAVSADEIEDSLIDNAESYPENCKNLMEILRIVFKLGVHPNAGDIVYNLSTQLLTSKDYMFTHEIIRSIPMFCFKRDIESISRIASMFDDVGFLKTDVIDMIVLTVEKEPQEFDKMIESVQFYDNLYEKYFDRNPKIKDSIDKYVNVNTDTVIENILMETHKILLRRGEISKFRPLLKYVYNKDELIYDYTKLLIQRFVQNGSVQTQYEIAAKDVIKNSSEIYKPNLIVNIIDGKMQADEMNFRQMLILNKAHWPYKSTSSSPKYLKKLIGNMPQLYKEKFSGRFLSFPIDFWYVQVRWEKKNCLISGNGTQIEFLLALNEKEYVTAEMYDETDGNRRYIPSQIGTPALETMIRKPCNILSRANQMFRINSSFTPESKNVFLPVPEEADNTSKEEYINRGKAIESSIAKTMKQEKTMFEDDLRNRIFTNLCQRFVLTRDDFQLAVLNLISANILQRKTERTLVYNA